MEILKDLYRNGFDEKTSNIKVDKKEVKRIVKYFKEIKLRSENRGCKNGNHFNYKITSYGLKHALERACDFACANGNVIQAMHKYGFKVKRIENSVNVRFNLSNEEINYLLKLNQNIKI